MFGAKAANSDYLHDVLTAHIPRDAVRRIFELGARDGEDTILLRNFFQCPVIAFECNPQAIRLCKRKLRWRRHITLVEAAVWHEDTEIDFFPVTNSSWADGRATTDGYRNRPMTNIGASSCFEARGDYLQHYEQRKIRVPAVRLETFCRVNKIPSVDLLCLDLQGAALQALKGLGCLISTVRYIIAELENREIYHGQSLYPEVHDYLVKHGFRQVAYVYRDDWFGDYLYAHHS